MANKEQIVELQHVALSFGNLHVLRDISFSISAGESVTIIGPSGSGKTQILKMISGLIQPTRGAVKVLGQDLSLLSEADLVPVRRNIGMLFQGAALFDSLTVYENIAYSLREIGEATEEEITSRVDETLKVVGLPGIEKKTPPQLSGGQKKRVGLARALASSPKVILFDEPTTGLDPTAIRMIDDLIRKLQREFGMTCITVTHDIESAKKISDRWLLINNGTIGADGAVDKILRDNQDVINFVTGNWTEDKNGN